MYRSPEQDQDPDQDGDQDLERILVIGIGNPLVEDEGVGVRVAEELMTRHQFPDSVVVMDAGTMGMGMLQLFKEHDRLVVIDALDGSGEPAGTVVRMDPADLAGSQVMHSLHDVKLSDVLEAADFMGHRPDVEFVGIQVASMRELVTELTPEVERAVPEAVSTVLDLLADLGVTVGERETRSADDRGARAIADARVIRAIRTREEMLPDDGHEDPSDEG